MTIFDKAVPCFEDGLDKIRRSLVWHLRLGVFREVGLWANNKRSPLLERCIEPSKVDEHADGRALLKCT